LSSTLATQANDQDRYVLAETIIVAQVALRDKLLEEQQTMIDMIRSSPYFIDKHRSFFLSLIRHRSSAYFIDKHPKLSFVLLINIRSSA
jgi:hypothetical protein